MTWVTTGHGYLEWEETCPRPKQVRSGVGGESPHQKQKSGVGNNILQQNGSVSKSDTRPNSEVGRSKNGSVSKSDTRPDRNSEVGRSKNGSVSKSDTQPDRNSEVGRSKNRSVRSDIRPCGLVDSDRSDTGVNSDRVQRRVQFEVVGGSKTSDQANCDSDAN